MPTDPQTYGRFVAYVLSDLTVHSVLKATGCFAQELSDLGWDACELDMPAPPAPGLLSFDGRLYYTAGPDPDAYVLGQWRRLNHRELLQLEAGDLWAD